MNKFWSRDNEFWGLLYVFIIAITGPFGAVVMVLQLLWHTHHEDPMQVAGGYARAPSSRKQRKEAEYARLDEPCVPDPGPTPAERAADRERAARVKADANRERILRRRRANGENV